MAASSFFKRTESRQLSVVVAAESGRANSWVSFGASVSGLHVSLRVSLTTLFCALKKKKSLAIVSNKTAFILLHMKVPEYRTRNQINRCLKTLLFSISLFKSSCWLWVIRMALRLWPAYWISVVIRWVHYGGAVGSFHCFSCQAHQQSLPLEIRLVLSLHFSYLLPHFSLNYRALMKTSGCFSIPKQLSIIPAARCQFELWLPRKQLGKDQPWIYLPAGPRGKIKEFLYVFTCSEVLIQTYLILIKRNRSTWVAFFLGHSIFSHLCPMKLTQVFVFHVSGWYMATEKLFRHNAGGVFGQSFIGKIINSERSEDSSHHPIEVWLGESEGMIGGKWRGKNKLGQLLIQSIDNVKFQTETWAFSPYQISCQSFSTRHHQIKSPWSFWDFFSRQIL